MSGPPARMERLASGSGGRPRRCRAGEARLGAYRQLTSRAAARWDEEPSQGLAARIRGAFSGVRESHQGELIATLNEVADAVSSTMNVEEVLDVIVERAKRIASTDKALLVLADEHSEKLDLKTIVVRGRRQLHPQEWWQGRLGALAEMAFESGEPLVESHPAHDAWLLGSPVLVKDHPIGLLGAINSGDRPFGRLQVESLQILCAFAASAIENARLAEQSRYVMLASERDRIAREMHDGVLQSLFSISLGMELCKKQVSRDPVGVVTRLDELQEHLNTSMTELRRFIYDLRPMKLTELGLVGAVEYWLNEITQGLTVKARLTSEGDLSCLTPSQEAALYRVAKEAVSNAIRHSYADLVEVSISCWDGVAELTVSDDGMGFDVDSVMEGGAGGIGLRSISQRVKLEGGAFSIESRPGCGTSLAVHLHTGGALDATDPRRHS